MPTIDALLRSLQLEQTGADTYTAPNAEDHGTIFGGQLLGQSIVAALTGRTGKTVKTINTIFARAGASGEPVDIRVEPVHDGRTFASSNVSISQGGRVCARSLVLLSADEDDVIRHGEEMPGVPPPDEATTQAQGDWHIQIVGNVDLADPDKVGPAELDVWTKFAGAPADAGINQALIAYATDAFLIGTAMRPHKGVGQAQAHKSLSTGVIGHTLTFHEPMWAGDWFLIAHHSSYAGHGRTYGRADVFSRDGQLTASFVQDAMIRRRDEGAKL